jgi:hypothetical protein
LKDLIKTSLRKLTESISLRPRGRSGVLTKA